MPPVSVANVPSPSTNPSMLFIAEVPVRPDVGLALLLALHLHLVGFLFADAQDGCHRALALVRELVFHLDHLPFAYPSVTGDAVKVPVMFNEHSMIVAVLTESLKIRLLTHVYLRR